MYNNGTFKKREFTTTLLLTYKSFINRKVAEKKLRLKRSVLHL